MRLVNYGPDFPADRLPKLYAHYEGREPGAPWRAAAAARIEKIRKGDFTLRVVDAAGKPVPGAEVKVALKRHAFGFGTAVTAQWLNNDSEDGRRYRGDRGAAFQQGGVRERSQALCLGRGLEALERQLPHGVVGPRAGLAERTAHRGARTLPDVGAVGGLVEKLRDDPAALRAKIMDNLRKKVPVVGDRVCEWDAVNHPAGWSGDGGVERATGSSSSTTCSAQPGSCRSGPCGSTRTRCSVRAGNRTPTRHHPAAEGEGRRPGRHRQHGALPPVVCARGAGHAGDLRPVAALVPNLQITEYDFMSDGDERWRPISRDILTMAFSHRPTRAS
ncbi:MAG: hypothetical protein U1F87_11255 [Kiritimatiellia bacterium]